MNNRTDQHLVNILLGGNVGRRGEPRVKPGGQERGGRRLIRLIFRWDLLGWGGGRTLILCFLIFDSHSAEVD